MENPPPRFAAHRRWLWWSAIAYLVFVVYGSLVPWDFRPLALDQAWHGFRHIPFLDLGPGSRADWVANILLFVPLGFLAAGAVWPSRGGSAGLAVGLGLWIASVGLSLLIEFTQLFFPPRTVSQNDVIAEAIGAAVGIVGWRWKGAGLVDWVAGWRRARGAPGICERLLWLYLVVLFGYNLLPLDLTISPVEIYHKWREGRVVLLPFGFLVEDAGEWAYNFVTDVLIWIPVSFLWIGTGKKGRLQAWRWAVVCAVVLEGLQLLVYSRVTDVTDVLTAMLGAAIGVWLSRRTRPGAESPREASAPAVMWMSLVGFLGWSALLAAIFWYPYDFSSSRELLRDRFVLLAQLPFYNYYFGTEFRAVTEVLHKLVFFAPLGMVLALWRVRIGPRGLARALDVAAILGVAGVAFGIELGQVALPSKYPDSTDWLLETLGGALGYVAVVWLVSRLRVEPPRPARPTSRARGGGSDRRAYRPGHRGPRHR